MVFHEARFYDALFVKFAILMAHAGLEGQLPRYSGTLTIVRDPTPIVELTLGGVFPFSRYDLDLDYIKGLLDEAWSPLLARVRNMTTPAEFEVAVDVEAGRPELERSIVRELLERDARFRPAAEDWARVALDVKRLVLEGSTPEIAIDYLRRSRAELVTGAEGGG